MNDEVYTDGDFWHMVAFYTAPLFPFVVASVIGLFFFILFQSKETEPPASAKYDATSPIYDEAKEDELPNTIPSMKPSHPELGNIPDFGKVGSLHEFLKYLKIYHGPVAAFWWGKTRVVSISSTELWGDVLPLFDRPIPLFAAFQPLIGPKSVQYRNGKDGQALHMYISKSFTHSNVINNVDLFSMVIKKVLSGWNDGDTLDVQPAMMKAAIAAAQSVGIGDSPSDEQLDLLCTSYKTAWGEMETQLMLGSYPEEGSERDKKFKGSMEAMYDIVKEAISKVREPDVEGKEASDGGPNFVASLLKRDVEMDEDDIIAQVITVWVASFHTTGLLLTWMLYFLAKHKHVQEKVYEEIQKVVGKDEMTSEHLSDFVYVRQCIDESLRLSVLAPWGARVSDNDEKIGDYVIPKNTPILLPLGVPFESADIFSDPEVFDPDRFSAAKAKTRRQKHGKFVFSPFGFAGKRVCPGQRQTMTEAVVMLVEIFRNFQLELVEPLSEITRVYGLVTNPKEKIRVSLVRRVE